MKEMDTYFKPDNEEYKKWFQCDSSGREIHFKESETYQKYFGRNCGIYYIGLDGYKEYLNYDQIT